MHALWNTHEAAAYLGLAPNTLTNRRCLGTGPTYLRIGGRIRYRPSDVIAWANAGEVAA